jgi:fatty acid desaturase
MSYYPEVPMSALDTARLIPSDRLSRRPLTRSEIPAIAWPTLVLALGALTVFVAAATAAVGGYAPLWIAIPLNSAAVYCMFTVAHDALHRSLSRSRWVNSVVGRIAFFFVVPMASFSAFTYAHIQHHRYTNDASRDPDMFASHGPIWQAPFRWMLMDFFHSAWGLCRLRDRLRRSWRGPAAEIAENVVVSGISIAGLYAAVATNNFSTLLMVLLIPQRIALLFVGWWFDWLPHHALEPAKPGNPCRATRVRIGVEWLLAPIMLTSNYHLVHHLNPGLPFYRLVQAWWRDEDVYLNNDTAIATVFGRTLTPEEYLGWKHGYRKADSENTLLSELFVAT